MSPSPESNTSCEGTAPAVGSEPIPVGFRSLHSLLVNQLGALIVSGRVGANDNLPPEEELSQRFGVSRTVIREALRVLAAKGLVESRPKTGTRVRPREDWSLLDPAILEWQQTVGPTRIFLHEFEEIRSLLEPYAAQLAADRASDEQIDLISRAYQDMAAAVEAGDDEAFIEADVGFHRAIFAAGDNQLLRQMGNAVTTLLEVRHAGHDRIPRDISATLPEHEEVMAAIQRHDAAAAQKAMLTLVDQAAADDEFVAFPDSDE